MVSREGIIPTKSEYNLSRNVPKRPTSKPIASPDEYIKTFSTKIPSGPTLNQQSKGIPEVEDVSTKEKNQPIDESQKLTAELIEKLIECENQLSQRDQEKIKMVSEYESRIRHLETEMIILKGQYTCLNCDSYRLKEENGRLLNENKDLKKIKLELESQNDQLKQRHSNNYDGQMSLVEVENLKRNQRVLLNRLKDKVGNSDTENVLLAEISRLQEQVSASEINTKILDAEVSLLRQEKSTLTKKYHTLQRNYEDCTTRKKTDQAEIERLQKRIDELQAENKLLRDQVYEAEENSKYQREYELVLRPQIEAEIERLENEKSSRELQMQTYKTNITELENRVSLLRTDLGILQKKRDKLSIEIEGWKSQIENVEKMKSDLNSRRNQDRAQAEKDLVKEKERASGLERKLILMISRNDDLNSVIDSQQEEIEFLRKRMSEVTQEHKKQQEEFRQEEEIESEVTQEHKKQEEEEELRQLIQDAFPKYIDDPKERFNKLKSLYEKLRYRQNKID